MKKRYLAIPSLALLLSVPFCVMQKPLMVYAEGEEAQSSVAQSTETTAEQTSEKKGGIDIESITIDGKTIAQWKKELSDESTRNAAIQGIIWAAAIFLMGVFKWLIDHRVLTANRAQIALVGTSLKTGEAALKEEIARLKELVGEYQQRDAQIRELVEKCNANNLRVESLLGIVMTHDPTLVAAKAYEKAQAILGKNDGEEGTQD